MAKILIIDDEEQLRRLMARIIGLEGYEVAEAPDCASGLKMLRRYDPDVVLCDVKLPDGNGVEMVARIKEAAPAAEVILLTAYGNIPDGVQAIKNGAFDYITKGDDNNKILPLLSRAAEKAEMQRRLTRIENKLSEEHSFDRIVGDSEVLRRAVDLARKVAVTDTSVLLTGETGTGKEVFAQAIHHASRRAKGAFVAINCSAFSRELLESELFGHKKGSFTDAHTDRAGKFEAAHEGTLFLDEIGNLPYHLQSKLLTAIQSRSVVRVGSNEPIPVNIRLICATNCNLEEMVAKGKFREDLLYRINTIHIEIPPLRERKEDIIPLAERFIDRFCKQYDKGNILLSTGAQEKLRTYPWYGNIRELEHAVEKAVIINEDGILSEEHFHFPRKIAAPATETSVSTLEEMELQMIQKAIEKCNGNLSAVAAQLGITRQTLYNKMKKFGL